MFLFPRISISYKWYTNKKTLSHFINIFVSLVGTLFYLDLFRFLALDTYGCFEGGSSPVVGGGLGGGLSPGGLPLPWGGGPPCGGPPCGGPPCGGPPCGGGGGGGGGPKGGAYPYGQYHHHGLKGGGGGG